MKIYDISQELFTGRLFPGDPGPEYKRALKISEGAVCNLTELKLGAHNGTHMDAPYHFYDNGKTIEQLDLNRCIGLCTVADISGLSTEGIAEILKNCRKRLLLKCEAIDLKTAKLLNQFGIVLIGVEGQSVGPAENPVPVHLELLKTEMVILEGLSLCDVPEGEYFLSAAPLKLGGCDGAPCRAVLIDFSGDFNESGACNC